MTETLERAVTIHQPWAWAVAAGHKPVENRTWRPPLEAVGRLVGIHAGLRPYSADEWDEVMRAWNSDEDMPVEPLTVGALIGVARLVGVISLGNPLKAGCLRFWRHVGRSKCVGEYVPDELAARIRPWWRGPWGWLFEEAVLLPEPIPMRGQQGLWRIPDQLRQHGDEFKTAARRALEQWRKARETR